MKKHWTLMIPGALLLCATPAAAIELRDAVQAALQTNPEIRQAIHNKEATLREREQAKGPRIKKNAQLEREIESLKMARTALEQQLKATTNSARKAQLTKALEDLDSKIAALTVQR